MRALELNFLFYLDGHLLKLPEDKAFDNSVGRLMSRIKLATPKRFQAGRNRPCAVRNAGEDKTILFHAASRVGGDLGESVADIVPSRRP